jgi:hypothetical protein
MLIGVERLIPCPRADVIFRYSILPTLLFPQIFPPSSFQSLKYSFPSIGLLVWVCAQLSFSGSMRVATKGASCGNQHPLARRDPTCDMHWKRGRTWNPERSGQT